MLTKEDLKHEIDQLDDSHLELVLHLLQQFPHQSQNCLEDYEYNQKMKRLQTLIVEGDADIKAGRITEYKNAKELADSITQ